jgi:3-phenylpropionate/cinnamic acid dioxygenase small subunit
VSVNEIVIDERTVTDFVRHETHLLNEEKYAEWLELLSGTFDYRLPNPELHDDPRIHPYSKKSLLAWESVHSLRLRFDRISSEYAWADRPRALHRRHLTAIRVRPGDQPDEWHVSCDELVARSRTPEGPQIVSALREDVVRLEDGWLRLAKRTVYIDVDRPDLAQITVLF